MITMGESISNYPKTGFENINGHIVQVSIGAIDIGYKQVDVEVLAGCSKVGLTNAMKDIAKETRKTVKAVFKGKEVTIKPKR